MPRRRDSAGYPTPYTAVLIVDGAMYLIVDRTEDGFRAVRLRGEQRRSAQFNLDSIHADIEARIVGFRPEAAPTRLRARRKTS